ncbi:helix-turn-helix domain-containing protein [Kribbella sp. NPDC056861]|uniref:helix-turn-helix transcriptional regulator n=1 Tax=Kribbella sp. NPDC056861 TaxID=3154857 RepID=UPI003428E3A2
MMDRLLTLDEVSELTRVPVNTLRYWRHCGTGPSSARLGKRVVYRESEVVRFVDEQFADSGRGGDLDVA